MGEMADLMIYGDCCQHCGAEMCFDGDNDPDTYEAPGHPVSCESCEEEN